MIIKIITDITNTNINMVVFLTVSDYGGYGDYAYISV